MKKILLFQILLTLLLGNINSQDEQLEIGVDSYEYVNNTIAFPFEINRVNNSTSSLMLGTDNSLYATIAGNNVGVRFGRYYGNDDTFHEHFRTTQLGNFGIGTSNPESKLQIKNGDIYLEDINSGVILTSPNGNCWRMTVSNDGNPVFNSVPCPHLSKTAAK